MSFKLEMHKELTQVTTLQDTSLGIMKWGRDNSFPQTLKNLIEQSPSAKPAVSRTAKFYKGTGFIGEEQIVSPYGLTLRKVVSILADDLAVFEAFAIHCNFNIKGQVTGINPLRITDLRMKEFDELNFSSKIGYHEDFGRNSEVTKTTANSVTRGKIKWFDRFNPSAVLVQVMEIGKKRIKEGTESQLLVEGISDYRGQVLYFTETGHSSYPIPPLQAPINYVLADVENSILVRKETATGFINSYILKSTLDAEDPNLIAFENAIDAAQGARGTGKIITLSGLSPEDVAATVLEVIGGGAGDRAGIIDSAAKAYELTQKVIYGTYLIPPILAGADVSTGFSTQALKDAYFVFNSITQGGRDSIEAEINRVLKNSIFDVKSIKINPLTLDTTEIDEEEPTKP